MEDRVQGLIQQLHDACDAPVAVGFGVSGASQVPVLRAACLASSYSWHANRPEHAMHAAACCWLQCLTSTDAMHG